jgi:hypothetical protein
MLLVIIALRSEPRAGLELLGQGLGLLLKGDSFAKLEFLLYFTGCNLIGASQPKQPGTALTISSISLLFVGQQGRDVLMERTSVCKKCVQVKGLRLVFYIR